MTMACRNCATPLKLPPGLDPTRCKCPKCGIVSPLAAPKPAAPTQAAPIQARPTQARPTPAAPSQPRPNPVAANPPLPGNQSLGNVAASNDPLGGFDLGALEASATPLGYPAPGYGQPGYGAPQYGAPQYGAPQYGAPQYAPPNYGQPQYGGMPAYGGYGAPGYGQRASRGGFRQFYRRHKKLIGSLILLLMLPCLCVASIAGGVIGIRAYIDYRTERYAALNASLGTFLNPPDVDVSRRPPVSGYVRGKFVIVDKDAGEIHSYHDGSDELMGWKPEEIGTVIWLSSRDELVGYYIKEEDEGKFLADKTPAYKEIVTATVIDLKDKQVVGGFTVEADVPDEIGRFENGRATVKRTYVMTKIKQLEERK